ncbi:hypothetical protein M153_4127000180 [Pseudoloma neurophilia]|uniref:Uncharacterized protein n=1 Tax=Pseudoloma neurophilia TaxID=146866 RepID=A0A0R0M0R1_9MICR|nr:hypothetical protein M153_4127000180 [Pseudoloma neurophilia]
MKGCHEKFSFLTKFMSMIFLWPPFSKTSQFHFNENLSLNSIRAVNSLSSQFHFNENLSLNSIRAVNSLSGQFHFNENLSLNF